MQHRIYLHCLATGDSPRDFSTPLLDTIDVVGGVSSIDDGTLPQRAIQSQSEAIEKALARRCELDQLPHPALSLRFAPGSQWRMAPNREGAQCPPLLLL